MGLRSFIQRNFWAKFLSFVLAFMTWLSIRTTGSRTAQAESEGKIPVSGVPEVGLPNPGEALNAKKPSPAGDAVVSSDPFSRPVAIYKPAGDAHAYEVKPAEVELVVKGQKESLEAMETKEIRVFVDITGVLEKFKTAEQHAGIPVRIEVHTPKSVALEKVTPNLATVKRIPPPEPPRKPEVKPTETIKPGENVSTNKTGLIKAATNDVDRAAATTNAAPKSGNAGEPTTSQEPPQESDKQTKAEPATGTGSAADNE
jgi:hypothetical protein